MTMGLAHPSMAAAAPKVKVDNRDLNRQTPGTSYAGVVKRVTPSVVNIYSTRNVKERSWELMMDPMFRRFFGEAPGRRQGQGQDRGPRRRESGLGAGVIVSADGYILTNNHVVEGADEIEVGLSDGKTRYKAKVVGTDPQTDVAVLKVEATGLPALTLGDSDKLEVGDVVLAIGNPFNVGQTVTQGIISGIGRNQFHMTQFEDYIQTDAAINPGNSGGPLVDAEGRFIGINTFILTGGTMANAGVGFAIPVNLARSVMERLAVDGKVRRGFLGVSLQPVTPDLAKAFNLSDESGALINEVSGGFPGEKAGLKNGDVVVEFNDKAIKDSRHLQMLVAQTTPGSKATLKVIRDGQSKTLVATLGERDRSVDEDSDPAPQASPAEASPRGLDGLSLSDPDRNLRRQFNIPASVRGVVITEVEEGSDAAEAGITPGMVILDADRKPVETVDDLMQQAGRAKNGKVLLRVWSGVTTRFVVLSVAKAK